MTQFQLFQAVNKVRELKAKNGQETAVLTIGQNLNKKLYSDYFSHIQKYKPQFTKNQKVAVFLKNQYFGLCEVVEIRTFKLENLPEVSCFLSQGISKKKFITGIKDYFLETGENLVNTTFTLYLFKYIEREFPSMPYVKSPRNER